MQRVSALLNSVIFDFFSVNILVIIDDNFHLIIGGLENSILSGQWLYFFQLVFRSVNSLTYCRLNSALPELPKS